MYRNFAYIYDQLMQDVPYAQWVKYLNQLLDKYQVAKGLALDLGCGTGTIAVMLAQQGWQVTALDLSSDMLSVAEAKAREAQVNLQFIQQDMKDLELINSYALVMSMCDSLNYILRLEELAQVFTHVHAVLEPNGIFVFDLNSEYKVREIFGDNIYTLNEAEIAYIWENRYLPGHRTCQMDITFFVKSENGYFRRFNEQHAERGYFVEEVVSALEQTGFKVEGVFAEQTFTAPQADTERIYYIARKV